MSMRGLHYDLDSLFPESPDFLQEEEVCEKDYDNIKRLYPGWTRQIAVIIEEYVDRYEYEGSPIYHQYPDEVTIYGMADDIYYIAHGNNVQNNSLTGDLEYDVDEHKRNERCSDEYRDFIQVMLCDEIYRRRRRHDNFTKCHRYRK